MKNQLYYILPNKLKQCGSKFLLKYFNFKFYRILSNYTLLYFSLFFLFSTSYARNLEFKFERISIKDGLSQSSISIIYQDSKGFLWFGTQDGLNRYDGYTFTVYKHNPMDSCSISDNWINSITEDSSGNLWIGTAGGGLNKFDKKSEKFSHYRVDPSNPNSLSSNQILTTFIDSGNNLWIGTGGGGLNKLDLKTETFIVYKFDPDKNISISDNTIVSVIEDRSGYLWIGTANGGLNRFDKSNSTFHHYKHHASRPNTLCNNHITKLYMDTNGLVWIGTENGLNSFDPIKETFICYQYNTINPFGLINNKVRELFEDSHKTLWIGTDGGINLKFPNNDRLTAIRHNSNDVKSLSENLIQTIYEDRSGIIWIGTYGGGLNKYDQKRNLFAHYKHDPTDPLSLSDNNIWSFCEDRMGSIWIGTNNGLNKFNPKSEKFKHFKSKSGQSGGLSQNIIRAICEDYQGDLWCGTDGGGLNRFNRKTQQFELYEHDPLNKQSLSANKIKYVFEDRDKTLWIATWDGLDKFDRQNNLFIHFRNDPADTTTLSDNHVRTIFEDQDGNLWIGTYGGLNLFDKTNGKFKSFIHKADDANSLSNQRVLSIHEDRAGRLWIGTFRGLNKFDKKKSLFTQYTVSDGLPNDVIYGIVEDEEGMLWLSTNKGLVKYDPNLSPPESFKSFDVKDGLQSDEFNGGAYLKSDSGDIYFGGINGFNKFTPHSVKQNQRVPLVVLTAFKKFDKIIKLDQSISETKELKLSYEDNFFSFEFAALDFTNPEKNQYAYKLEGFDENWIECGNRHYASYTNLDGGEYIFRARGSNNDGIWNNTGTSIRIIINPPFWKTWWFRIAAILVILISGYAYYKIKINQIKKQREVLKSQVKEQTKELVASNLKLQKAKAGAQRSASQNYFIYEIGKRITEELELDTVLDEVVNSALDVYGYHGVMLFMFDKKQNGLALKSIVGGYKDVFPVDLFVKMGEGMIGQAALTMQSQLSNDVSKSPDFVKFAKEVTRSELSVPIVSNKELIGVLDIQSTEINAFSETDAGALETLSVQIASAIKNARLYEQAQIEITERRRAESELRESRDRLAAAKKETDNIMKNVEEGLFLVNPNGEIGAQYSQSLEVILNKKDLSQKNLIKLLENKIPSKTLSSSAEYIELMFNDDIDENTINELNPLAEVELNVNNKLGIWKDSKYLLFKFKRILNAQNKTSELIATVNDISHQKRLAQQLEETEAQQKKQMELMLSILHVEPALLKEFMVSIKKELKYISTFLRQSNKSADFERIIQNVYRSMHLIKGNASLLDLQFFVKQAHLFEDKISEIQELTEIKGSDFIPLVLQLENMRNMLTEIDKLIGRLGKIHNQFRPKRDYENKLFIQTLSNLIDNLAKDLGKEVHFSHENFDSGQIQYEYRLSIKEILVQLIRNAIYHGIENSDERLLKNKNPIGTIKLSGFLENEEFHLNFKDDGGGVQISKLRKTAKELNKWDFSEIDRWDDSQIAQLMFEPGISTSDEITSIAGRGVGMDVIKEKIEKLDGKINVKSVENEFCEFIISIPFRAQQHEGINLKPKFSNVVQNS